MLISPTSWTADERLELLFEALEKYEARARRDPRFPFLAVLITGKGPLEGVFNQRVAASHFKRVRIQTGWLPSHEYAATLAAADLGISCHVSASGLDLPMKILDLFGAGVPVCAYDYGPCLLELVSPGDNGVTVQDRRGVLQSVGTRPVRLAEFEGHARPAAQRRDRVGRHIVERSLDRRSTRRADSRRR